MKHRLTLCVSSVLFILSIQCSLGVVFYSTPQDLDDVKDNSSVIVAGSVIQLFCSASGQLTPPHIQWTRNNITIPETAQLPHLMVKSRTQNNFTSSTLIIGGFTETDNGSYSCLAQETGGSSAVSAQLLLTVSVASGVIKVIRELSSTTGNILNASGFYSDDRTYVPLGSPSSGANGSFLRCSAEQPGSLQIAAAPSIKWLKDGVQLYGDGVRVVINTSISIVATSNRTCVFYDTPSQGGEVVTTRPYKVDTGPIRLTTLFPSTITFCPPGSLIIQVEAGGEYAGIQWIRTPRPLNIISDQLVDYDQTFVMTPTSINDSGIYTINLVTSSNTTSASASINFTVMFGTPNLASTTVAPDTVVTKLGMSVDILCTSSGYPVPTVSWYYRPDDQSSLYGPLPQSVAVGSPIQVCNGVCSCRVNSSLYIRNASRSIHQGIYLCVGVSIINGNTLLSNASVNLVVMSGNESLLPSQATSPDILFNVIVILSVVSAVIIVILGTGLVAVIVQLRKKNCVSTQSLNHATGTEMTPREIDVVPKPQETYSRLFQDTPFYKPHQGRGAFNTQSVVTLAVQDHKELRESKSASSFLDVPLPRGYEKPVSSTESVANRNGDQTAVLQADRRIVGNTSPRIPTIPVYTDNEQEEDFVTVEELDEMNQRRHRNHHRYVDQGTSPSVQQLLSSTSVLDPDS
ncbi:hypothetical protein EMCRGX_G013702 [Ephydatia muelleri]